MALYRLLFSLLGAAAMVGMAPVGAVPAQSPDEPSQEPSVIVEGTVTRVKAATSQQFPQKDKCVVIKLGSIRGAPADLLNDLKALVGKEVTVRVGDTSRYHPGEHKVFYTKPWILGDSLSLAEVKPAETLAANRVKTGGAGPPKDTHLSNRLKTAALVIAGTVVTVRSPGGEPPLREHVPDWKDVSVRVDDVLKGKLPSGKKVVELRVPGTKTRPYADFPKLRPGQRGIFLLHRNPDLGRGLMILDPSDFQPLERLGEVRGLLRPTR